MDTNSRYTAYAVVERPTDSAVLGTAEDIRKIRLGIVSMIAILRSEI